MRIEEQDISEKMKEKKRKGKKRRKRILNKCLSATTMLKSRPLAGKIVFAALKSACVFYKQLYSFKYIYIVRIIQRDITEQ